MGVDRLVVTQYLQQLFDMTAGDGGAQVSMYDVGEAIGLDRSEAGALAQDLMVDGLLELKSLAGGVSITREGLNAINVKAAADEPHISLGAEPYLGQAQRQAVEDMCQTVKQLAAQEQFPYEDLEQMVIELKTLEVQLLSGQPRTPVVREVLRSIGALTGAGREVTESINALIES